MKTFATHSFVIAVLLYANNHSLLDVVRTSDGKKAQFIFDRTSALDSAVVDIQLGTLPKAAPEIFENTKKMLGARKAALFAKPPAPALPKFEVVQEVMPKVTRAPKPELIPYKDVATHSPFAGLADLLGTK